MKKVSMYLHGQTGKTKVSTIVWILILAAIVYVIVKIAPVYIINYQIQNLFEVNANRIQTTPMSDIKADIQQKLANLNAPITMDDVTFNQNSPTSITISTEYSTAVKFVDGYKITFHFSPKATTDVQ